MMIKKNQKINEASIKVLIEAIHDLHDCKSIWIKSVPVKEMFQDETVWDGIVQVFDLIDHPTATRCYAWSHAIDNSKKRRFFAILHIPPIVSARDAVRAAIIHKYKQ